MGDDGYGVMKNIGLFSLRQNALVWIILSLCWATSANAQSNFLTRAEVYKVSNQVQLLPYRQSPKPAKLQDQLVPRDGLQTAAKSHAELLFNEGTLARIGEKTLFRFLPGTQNYQLQNGVIKAETLLELTFGEAFVSTSPEPVTTRTQTPVSRIEVKPNTQAAFIVEHWRSQNTTQVFALTDSNIRVATLAGTSAVTLKAGEKIKVTSEKIGNIEKFNRDKLLKTQSLIAGFTSLDKPFADAALADRTAFSPPQIPSTNSQSIPEPSSILGLLAIGLFIGFSQRRN